MTIILNKDKEVFVRSNKELEDFVVQVSNTIENHLQYVDDKDTKEIWLDLKCNGITDTKPMTPTVLSRILEIMDPSIIPNMG